MRTNHKKIGIPCDPCTDPKVRSAYPTLARPTSATHNAGAALSSRVYWSSIARLTKSRLRRNGTRHEVDGVTLPSLLEAS
jgi:hypothetical protein